MCIRDRYSSRVDNFGEIENKGFEIGLQADLIKNNNFSWNLYSNFSLNRNMLMSLNSNLDYQLGPSIGEVPLRITPVDASEAQQGLPLSSISDIYTSIIGDLQYAADNCWDRNESRNGEVNNLGRATKASANALLAKVYLRMASCKRTALEGIEGNNKYLELSESVSTYYQSAKEHCDAALIDTGFGLSSNLENWVSIFDADNGNNSEMLFDVQGSDEIGQGTAVSNLFTPRNSGLSGTGFGGSNKLKPRFVNFHLNKDDPRFQNSILREYQNTNWSFSINNASKNSNMMDLSH